MSTVRSRVYKDDGLIDIKSLSLAQLQDTMTELGHPKYRALQVYKWIWQRGVKSFEEMSNVSGDVGARHLIGKHEDVAVEIEIDDDSVLMDVDTPEALAKLTAGSS